MSPYITWLITVLYGDTLIKCSLKVHKEKLEGDCDQYPMEPENRKQIHALLPLHVQSCGPIVAIDSIFESHVVEEDS